MLLIRIVTVVLFARELLAFVNDGPGVRHPGRQTHKHRNMPLLGIVEGFLNHLESLLLVRRLETRHHREICVEARILLVLRRMLRWVVAGSHHQASVRAGHGRIHEAVCANVHSNVLHADKGSFPSVRHSESSLHGGLLVSAPVAVDVPFFCKRVRLDILGYFGRRGARVSVHTGNPSVQSTQAYCFVT